jgi:predicted AAA+ superfamily ATPase
MKTIKRRFTRILQDRLQEDLNFLQVVLGPRQVGKTTGLQQIVAEWPGPSLMVTADEIAAPDEHWISQQWETARRMGRGTLFVVDEVQKIPRWSDVVKYLFDRDRSEKALKIVLLGSASLSVQRGLGESLAGRFEIVRADHWDLPECELAMGWTLDDFLKFGGYPAAAELTGDVKRWQRFVRDAIIEPVLIKDILGLSSVGKPALFRQTFELTMSYPAREVSLQKLLGQLQQSGNVNTIKHYLELLDGAFLLKTLQKYTGSEIRKRGSSPKLLPLNTALIHAMRDPRDVDTDPAWFGRVFESAVGAALAKSNGNLYYWRDGKNEVDYCVDVDRRLYAIEVKSQERRRAKGLAVFKNRHPNCVPVVIDRLLGEQLLRAESVDDFLKQFC